MENEARRLLEAVLTADSIKAMDPNGSRLPNDLTDAINEYLDRPETPSTPAKRDQLAREIFISMCANPAYEPTKWAVMKALAHSGADAFLEEGEKDE